MIKTGQLNALERAGRPLQRVLHGEDVITLKTAAEMSYTDVMVSIEDPEAFTILVIVPEEIEATEDHAAYMRWPAIPVWQVRALQAEWVARNDVGTLDGARRLAFLLDRYWPDLEHDLRTRAQLDLAATWQARRWRLLLDAIDRLPSDTFYQESISLDEEHISLIIEANARSGQEASAKPRMSTWSPLLAKLTEIADLISVGNINTIKMNTKPGGSTPQFHPGERPESIYAQLEHRRKQAAHETLADRVLRRGVFADQPQP